MLGYLLRVYVISKANIVFDYDQVEDIFWSKAIVDGNIAIIGRPIYGNPNLHHGVFFFYLTTIPYFFFKGSPFLIAYWDSIFNVGTAIVLYLFSIELFSNKKAALLSALIYSFSYEAIQFSGWISSTTPTIFTIPVFFLGLVYYHKNKRWGLIIAAIALGLSIQMVISNVYFGVIAILLFIILKLKTPDIKTLLLSGLAFLVTTSTLILTEVKLNFAGVKTFLNFADAFDDTRYSLFERLSFFLDDLAQKFSNSLYPSNSFSGIYLFILVVGILLLLYINNFNKTHTKAGITFLLVYLFSPLLTLFLGYHRQPWFLIGIIPAIALVSGYALSKIKSSIFIFAVIGVVVLSNISKSVDVSNKIPELFKPEVSGLLSSQLEVVDYTYNASGGKAFAINAVNYPLYHHAIWAYHYDWYGKNKYGYLPGWYGGSPGLRYETLPKPSGKESTVFMIIDNTIRIPETFKNEGRAWSDSFGKVIDEKVIGGFTVQKIQP